MIGEKEKMVDGKFTFEMPELPRMMMAFRIIDPDAIEMVERVLGDRKGVTGRLGKVRGQHGQDD